uniref:Dynein axonemal intermediate chain 1 n=1 Tax=Nothobranchius furzeri TaxID=105023 RepID=A0A8C6LFE0_NOTFU
MDKGDGLDRGKKSKPSDQLKLTEAELKENITKVLNTHNPHAPQNIVRFNYKEGVYQRVSVDHTAILFEMESNIVYQDSEEGRRLMLKQGLIKGDVAASYNFNLLSKSTFLASLFFDLSQATPVEDGGEVEEAEEEDRPDSVASKADKKGVKLGNFFHFTDRATQTLNNPPRQINCQTAPPPRSIFSATANQWQIYDAYCEELQKQEKQKATLLKKETDKSKKGVLVTETQVLTDLTEVAKETKILERMVHQNTFDEIAQDFKYFEDPSDKFRGQEGTLLPLWTFQHEETRGLSVTALCWNSKYQDLFAVGMGSYDFCKQGRGMIVFYSLKNSSFPEYVFPTTSGVQCLDIHPQHFYLTVVGFYDGCVAVYNLKKKSLEPVCKGTPKTSLLTNPVWQVRWQNDDIDNNHNFFSVSADSRVVSWTLIKHELISTETIRLSVNGGLSNVPDDEQLVNISGGTSLDFHKQTDHLFLVGTEQGKIHKCSIHYSSKFLKTYNAHNSAVYTVKWNHFHPRVFISCSADWTVKIWDDTIKVPVFTFDLMSAIGDVAWAPYSSTIFAAVTIDGIVRVFDLSINKYEAICQQLVVAKKKTKLTHIEFNPVHPVIIVGDDQGLVSSFKLSPNLRKTPKVRSCKNH